MNDKIKILIERLKENYEDTKITANIKACYYILPDGQLLSIDFYDGIRGSDHRAIFSGTPNIKYNDWSTLHKTYNLVGYVPENNTAWISKNQIITKEQKKILKKYNIELIVENF